MKLKQIISVILLCAIIISNNTVIVSANDNLNNTKKEIIGFSEKISKPDSDAIVISSAEELASVTQGNYVLANDIDLSEFNAGYWQPIKLTGNIVIDGQGHIINNLKTKEDISYAGLISEVASYSCEIKNLGLSDVDLKGTDSVGGFIANANNYGGNASDENEISSNISLYNVFSEGNFYVDDGNVGALIGYAEAYTTGALGNRVLGTIATTKININASNVCCNIDNGIGTSYYGSPKSGCSGGLIGCVYGGSYSNGSDYGGLSLNITNVNCDVSINEGSYCGGILGYFNYHNSNNSFSVSNAKIDAQIYGSSVAGVLGGEKFISTSISNCEVSGKICGCYHVAGLIGEASSVDIENCVIYADLEFDNVRQIVGGGGSVSAFDRYSVYSMGGLIGSMYYFSSQIKDCQYLGNMLVKNKISQNFDFGAMIGAATCPFWNNDPEPVYMSGCIFEGLVDASIMENYKTGMIGYANCISFSGHNYYWYFENITANENAIIENYEYLKKKEYDIEKTIIKTIRKTPIKQYDSYNVVKYEDTDSGKIIKTAVNYNKAIEDYLSKLNKQASNDVKGSNKQQKSIGKQLMEKDKDIHTLTYVASEDYAIAAYEMLGQCYDEGIKKIDIGKIKITDDLITISSNIVKKIINSITRFEKTSRINGHTVRADILGAGGAITGTIVVDGVHFLVNSSYDKSTKIMNDYVNNLSDVVKDVLKQSLFSVLTELAHYTYIDQFAEDELKTLFNGKIDNLQKIGYGDLFKVLKGAKKTYNIAKKITAVKSSADLKDALTIDNLKEIYKELSDTDFSDKTIKNETVNAAYKNVMELKKALEDDLFNYIYGYKKEDEGVWQWIKRKININCPVDFTIRDADNNIVASIIDGIAKSNDSNIVLKLNGNEKVIYVLDERYINLQMTATDDGTMDIVIEDMNDGKPISRINYYDIKLTDENIYTQELNSDNISGQLNQFPIIYDKNKQINANDYFETTDDACVNVKCTSSEGGYIENDLSETYVKGDPVELYAISFDEYIFEGWYIDGKLVEVSPLYRFTAKSDVSIQASFKKKEVNYLTSLYDIEYGENYDDFAWINIYDKDTSAYDVELKMYGIDETDNDISTFNIMYKKGDITLLQKETIVLDENAEAYLDGILKKGYESITITDTERNLVATLLSNGELPDIEILPTSSPSVSPTATPTVIPTSSPSVSPAATPTVIPTSNPFGDSSGGYIPGPTATDPVIVPSPVPTPSPSQIPSPSPTVVPVTTITPAPVQTPSPTSVPEITPTSSVIPILSSTPEATLTPSASPVAEENNNTSFQSKLKKGLKVKDKKTKAVYKITSMGNNKTAEYVKSTKKNTTNIVIPASVKLKGKTFKVLSIGKSAFKNNKKIKSVKIGKNIKVIGKEAFSGCKKLANVQMGKNVNLIWAKAFNNCTSLIIITIPSKVKKIGKKAFYQCKNLQYIIVKTKKLKPGNIGSNAFSKGYSNPRVKSDKSIWKQYQDTFVSKGLSNKAVFIIDPVKLVI